MSQPGSLTWFARHESRLAWRDWLSMMTAGRRRRMTTVVIALTAFIAFLHLIAYPIVKDYAQVAHAPDKSALVVITGMLALSWSLMASQAMELVTRAFYSRADLDLILSSPASAPTLFAVRIATMTLATALMSLLLAAPFINVLAVLGGARWLAAYAVVIAISFTAMAFAVAITIALFMTLGPKRTRLVAQVMAAVIGAACVIGLQLAAIQSLGSLSRTEILSSSALVAWAPAGRQPALLAGARGHRRSHGAGGGARHQRAGARRRDCTACAALRAIARSPPAASRRPRRGGCRHRTASGGRRPGVPCG